MLAVPPEKLAILKAICAEEHVELADLGEFGTENDELVLNGTEVLCGRNVHGNGGFALRCNRLLRIKANFVTRTRALHPFNSKRRTALIPNVKRCFEVRTLKDLPQVNNSAVIQRRRCD